MNYYYYYNLYRIIYRSIYSLAFLKKKSTPDILRHPPNIIAVYVGY